MSSSIARMALAENTLDRLRTAGLAEIDPDVAGLLGEELERQRNQIELIASENFTWPSVLEAVGSVPTNKYAEGYPGKRYYGGCEIVDRIEQLAIDRAKALFRRGARERPATRGRAGEHGGVPRADAAGRHVAVAPPRSRRAPDPRPQGQLLRAALHDRALRRLARDEPRRLRRGAGAREGAPAEDDPVRRLCLSADGGDVGVPQDRGRGRRAPLVRHGALLGARRGRTAPEPDGRLRRRHLDHAQDARRAAGGIHPLPRGARSGHRPRRVPGAPGRAARARDRREGDVLPDRRLRCVPRLPDAGAGERRRAGGRDHRRRARRAHRRHRYPSVAARSAPHASGRARTPRSDCTRSG